ncbi:MAG TPA: hypothetical protein VGP13_02915 [Candidatus Paceibacterota bacterium]|jgi:hypothetical protein|nr:hypothetical protein [Candidatus Paceibacterota bacterium]
MAMPNDEQASAYSYALRRKLCGRDGQWQYYATDIIEAELDRFVLAATSNKFLPPVAREYRRAVILGLEYAESTKNRRLAVDMYARLASDYVFITKCLIVNARWYSRREHLNVGEVMVNVVILLRTVICSP